MPGLIEWLQQRCPLCGAGKLFSGWFRMKERCPGCGYTYEVEAGDEAAGPGGATLTPISAARSGRLRWAKAVGVAVASVRRAPFSVQPTTAGAVSVRTAPADGGGMD